MMCRFSSVNSDSVDYGITLVFYKFKRWCYNLKGRFVLIYKKLMKEQYRHTKN